MCQYRCMIHLMNRLLLVGQIAGSGQQRSRGWFHRMPLPRVIQIVAADSTGRALAMAPMSVRIRGR